MEWKTRVFNAHEIEDVISVYMEAGKIWTNSVLTYLIFSVNLPHFPVFFYGRTIKNGHKTDVVYKMTEVSQHLFITRLKLLEGGNYMTSMMTSSLWCILQIFDFIHFANPRYFKVVQCNRMLGNIAAPRF